MAEAPGEGGWTGMLDDHENLIPATYFMEILNREVFTSVCRRDVDKIVARNFVYNNNKKKKP